MNGTEWRTDPLTAILACMAVEPALAGIVLFDASAERALAAAHALGAMKAVVDGLAVRVTLLPSSAGEEEIWGAPRLPVAGPDAVSPWRRGILSPSADGAPRVILVPDLARISLAGARAAVAHAGADVASLERDGGSAAWSPRLQWIAVMARAQVGEVSPHLLDRFPLRLTLPGVPAADRAETVRAWATTAAPAVEPIPDLPPALVERLRSISSPPPAMPRALLAQVLARFPARETPGARRPIAMARLARAVARLDSARQVTPDHVSQAAWLVGLALADPPAARGSTRASTEAVHAPPQPAPAARPAGPPPAGQTAGAAPLAEVTASPAAPVAVTLDTGQALPASVLPYPYLEDTTPPARDAYSLQIPPVHRRDGSRMGGVPVGTGQADGLRDVAVVSTVLEAARYQRVRPPPAQDSGIRVLPTDLRSYRRTPVPQQVLALVLDYTALRNSPWQEAIRPYLKWAYAARASVCLVQVGAASAREPLRAQQITARNLLAPQIRAAFEEAPGTATPLAHGLDLADRVLRRVLQQGRTPVIGGVLVVVTDGRGNVPLDASLAGAVRGRVMREGVDDALRAARSLAEHNKVARVVLHPGPRQYPRLPLELAEAMGAAVHTIEPARPGAEGA